MLPSPRSLLAYAGVFFAQTPFVQGSVQSLLEQEIPSAPYAPLSGSVQCPINGPTSCHNSTPIADDSCCFVYPGGRMLLTQFWDAKVQASGSEQDWTIHGLWYLLLLPDVRPPSICASR